MSVAPDPVTDGASVDLGTADVGHSRVAVALASAIAAGIALGFATQILQGLLPGSWAVLANSGVMWVLAAFALGLVMPSARSAAFGGATALVVASFSYYVAVEWFEGVDSGSRGAVVWAVAGIVAGSSFGFAGFAARRHRRHRWSAWALVAGVVMGEGVHLTWNVGNAALRPAGVAELVVAIVATTICLRRAGSAVLILAITAAATLATLLAGGIIDGAFASW